jgi:hypothetical protein
MRTELHVLNIKSLHDAQASCLCGWQYSFTGRMSEAEIRLEWNKHCKAATTPKNLELVMEENKRLRDALDALEGESNRMVDILTRLTEKVQRANDLKHRLLIGDWKELYHLTNEAGAVLKTARGGR